MTVPVTQVVPKHFLHFYTELLKKTVTKEKAKQQDNSALWCFLV